MGDDREDRAVADLAEASHLSVARRLIRVLAIDDDAEILDLISCALSSERGYEVCTARHGAEGLEVFYRERPDCVIVDVQMPVMTGFQFLRALRGDSATAQTPVIILSALDGDAYHEAGELSGVDSYLQKPFKVNQLQATLQRVMRITPQEREQRQRQLADQAANRVEEPADVAP